MERQDLGSPQLFTKTRAIHSSTKYRNRWAVTIFSEWQIARSVIAPGLVPRGLFKGSDLHRTAQLFTSVEEVDPVTLNYWLSKFGMEVAKNSGEKYPPKTVYGIICGSRRYQG